MDIFLLNPTAFSSRISVNNYANRNNKPVQKYPNLAPLKADTVSFTGVPRLKGTCISDHLEAQFINNLVKIEKLATRFLNSVEKVANRLQERGFSFDRSYCELNPIKSKNSYMSKVKRQKELKSRDIMRTTIYCKNPYDLSNLDALIKEMDKEGYVIDMIETPVNKLMKRGYVPTEELNALMTYLTTTKTPKSKMALMKLFKSKGYDTHELNSLLEEFYRLDHTPTYSEILEPFGTLNKKAPDLDIRLDDIKDKIFLLPEKYQYCAGSPQKSGYEDIQIRFVRKSALKNKNGNTPECHELIVLFGENYAQAKHRESERVYSHLRRFDEMFAVQYFENPKLDGITKPAKKFIETIQNKFRNEISTKEFANAKSVDYDGITSKNSITFNDQDVTDFRSYFDNLTLSIEMMYEKLKLKVNTKKKSALEKREESNKKTIEEIRKNLKETIKLYQKEAKAAQKAPEAPANN